MWCLVCKHVRRARDCLLVVGWGREAHSAEPRTRHAAWCMCACMCALCMRACMCAYTCVSRQIIEQRMRCTTASMISARPKAATQSVSQLLSTQASNSVSQSVALDPSQQLSQSVSFTRPKPATQSVSQFYSTQGGNSVSQSVLLDPRRQLGKKTTARQNMFDGGSPQSHPTRNTQMCHQRGGVPSREICFLFFHSSHISLMLSMCSYTVLPRAANRQKIWNESCRPQLKWR